MPLALSRLISALYLPEEQRLHDSGVTNSLRTRLEVYGAALKDCAHALGGRTELHLPHLLAGRVGRVGEQGAAENEEELDCLEMAAMTWEARLSLLLSR